MKKITALILAIILIIACGSIIAQAEVYGNKYEGDIIFNSLEWGTSREEVYRYLKDKYSSIELIEELTDKKEYGSVIKTEYTYKPKSLIDYIGKVGGIDINKIIITYISEDGKYNESMYMAQYYSVYTPGYEREEYETLVEMLEYKYGKPYSYEEINDGYGSTKTKDNVYVWYNKDNTRKIELIKHYKYDSEYPTGHFYITYTDLDTRSYLSNAINEYREQQKLIEEQQRQEEIAGKDYDGL